MAASRHDSDGSARAAARAQIADMENQISRLEKSIRSLRLNQLESYQYPVLNLPNEIISEIFIHFLPVYPLCPPQTGLLSPTTLTHICRKWRDVALATPGLWRAILLCYESDNAIEQQVHTLETWLKRSGCCPLSIRMEDFDDIPLDDCIAAIAHHSARLEHAKLQMSLSGLLSIDGPMPLLRKLSI